MSLIQRYEGNPILSPIASHAWESLMVYNCAAIYVGGKVHILYRARPAPDGVSRLGYVSSFDGYRIDGRLDSPVFRADPDQELESLGCEDPRLTQIEDRIYMCYTALGNVPRMHEMVTVAQIGMTSISVEDFLAHRWNWSKRTYPFPGVHSKNACLFPKKIGGRYAMLHRIPPYIWIAYSDDLGKWHDTRILMGPREGWEYFKVGAGPPPIKTEKGWLLVYHAMDDRKCYRLGAALLDLEDPTVVLKRCRQPLLEPEADYEKNGAVRNVVFSCGAVALNGQLIVYYGAADTVIGAASGSLADIVDCEE